MRTNRNTTILLGLLGLGLGVYLLSRRDCRTICRSIARQLVHNGIAAVVA